jgi:nucleoside 2-deoxyribosyltransferase
MYFAAPLFSEAELTFNLKLTSQLERLLDVYLPQRDGGKVVDLVAKKVSIEAAYKSIFDRDLEALNDSDALLIVLDGRAVDEGAAFELGAAYSRGKRCIGLQTDPRRLFPMGNNPMIACALEHVFLDSAGVIFWAKQFINSRLSTMDAID